MSDEITDSSPRKAKCSICSCDLATDPKDEQFVLSYPNFVCSPCGEEGVTSEGTSPRHSSLDDDGDNPVLIRGIKCWRRYRFGGYITMRDLHDCSTIRDFYKRNGLG
jgi:hypothetical protein